MKRVSIVGAGGHLGRSLTWELNARHDTFVSLYSRRPKTLASFVSNLPHPENTRLYATADVGTSLDTDLVLNCVGHGDQADIARAGVLLLLAQERVEQMILEGLRSSADALYVSFSSGAAFGPRQGSAVDARTVAHIDPRDGSPSNGYAVAKLYGEIKHRLSTSVNIVDLRLYGFVSPFHPSVGRYLISDVIRALDDETELVTTAQDFQRDYSSPVDLLQLIDQCLEQRPINRAYDAYSLAPTGKFELLDAVKEEFGLRYRIEELDLAPSDRSHYFSTDHAASLIGYRPTSSAVKNVIDALRSRNDRGW